MAHPPHCLQRRHLARSVFVYTWPPDWSWESKGRMQCAWPVMIVLGIAGPSGHLHGTGGRLRGSPLKCTLQPIFDLHLLAGAWKHVRLPVPHLQAVQRGQSARHLLSCCPPQREQMPPRQASASGSGNPLQCHLTVSRDTSSRALACDEQARV